jgi:PKHD-type hydroxylase
MILCIDPLLPPGTAGKMVEALDGGTFRDGKATAGWAAAEVKNNLQLPGDDPIGISLAERIEAALRVNDIFGLAAIPKHIRRPMFSRCDPGMGYGTHVDNAIMFDPPIRCDLSFTVFLSDPAAYEGGELVIESASGEQDYKLKAGAMLLYPSTYLHRVNPVARGRRFVAVGWVQSLVRDPAHRELLFDLHRGRQLMFEEQGKTEAFDLISRTCSNLLRSWSEL